MVLRIKIIILGLILLANFIAAAQSNPYINAQVAFEKMQYKDAVDYLNLHISVYPKHDKSILLRAKSFIELGNYQLALEDISKLKVSGNNEIYLLLARANAGMGKNDLAFEQLDKYLGTNTKLPEPVIKSFKEFQALKTSDKWSTLWKAEHYTNKEIILNNAKYAIHSGNYAEAADRLDEYLLKYTRSPEAYYLRGNIYYYSKDYKLASEFYESALKLEPEFQECLLAHANCANEVGKYKTALNLFNSIIASDSLYIQAFLGRAKSLVENGSFDQAKSDIAKYRSYYPENKEAQFLEAYIDTKNGDFLNAISNYGQLIKANPGKSEYFIARANAYMATKTYKYAIKDFSMALDLEPKNIEVYKLKAKAHQLAGEINQACFEWQNAARLGDIESMDNFHKYCK